MEMSVTINAVRWRKDGDHSRVKLAGPMLLKRGGYFYVEGMWPAARFWMEIAEQPERPQDSKAAHFLAPECAEFVAKPGTCDCGKQPHTRECSIFIGATPYYRRVLNFSFWKVRGEKVHEEVNTPENQKLLEDYQMLAENYGVREGEAPITFVPYGRLEPAASDGSVAVFPGNWIVEIGDKILILSDEDFKKQYAGAMTAPAEFAHAQT